MPESELSHVTLHTDGACKGNPGPGGWGVVLKYKNHVKELSGGERDTTNNRMELLAAIQGLKALKWPCVVDLYTDSTYVRDGIKRWVSKWRSNGWKTSKGDPVKNEDLWRSLIVEIEPHEIRWHWVKGHSGDPGNEWADRLASAAAERVADSN